MSDAARTLEIETLAGERVAAVGQTVLAALTDPGLSGRRVANVVRWFIVPRRQGAPVLISQAANQVIARPPDRGQELRVSRIAGVDQLHLGPLVV